MHELALELGYFCTKATSYKVDLAAKIASSLRNRSGSAVYQSVAISIPHIPLEFCFQTFAFAKQELPTTQGTTTWTVATMDQTTQVFGSVFQAGDLSCSGASKALKSPSETVARVLATIMPGAVISHVSKKKGVDVLYINFLFALITEHGELHPPKDPNRNEIALTPQEQHEIRAQALSDAMALSAASAPLSPAWLRQLGQHSKARVAEAEIHNLSTAPMPMPGKRKRRADHYEIKKIVAEQRGWYLVEWAGYHESWEAWRISGEVGTPIQTWEQLRTLKNTEALRSWRG